MVEVPGGRTLFIPTMPMNGSGQAKDTKIILKSPTKTHLPGCLSNNADQYQLKAVLDLPSPHFVRGESYTITGKLLDSGDFERLVPLRVRLRLLPVLKRRWAQETIKLTRADLDDSIPEGRSSYGRLRRDPHTTPSVAFTLEEEMSMLKRFERGESLRQEPMRTRDLHGTAFDKGLNTFTATLKVREDELTSDKGIFEDVEMFLEIEVDTSKREEESGIGQGSL